MIKQVKTYSTGGGNVIKLSHNGSSWYVTQWGRFGATGGFTNKRTKFGNRKYDALAFYAECERELVVKEAMRALGIKR